MKPPDYANNAPPSRFNFTVSQLLQVLVLVVTGLMAWGNLKSEVRAGLAVISSRLDAQERRIDTLERHDDRRRGR
jgi:hypothetical protein